MSNITALKTKPASSAPDIIGLTEQYISAKAHLKTAQEIAAQAEAELLAAIGHKPEGSLTVTVNDTWKVTTTGKMNRTLDAKAWETIKAKIPAPLANRLVRYKPEISLTELRYIEINEPAYFGLISQALTVKPAKASVTVKEIN
jgi:hypothetical protein